MPAAATCSGNRFRARARAHGPVRLPSPELDLAWTLALDTEPGSPGAFPPSRLTAAGSARGALPPAIDAKRGGHARLGGARGAGGDGGPRAWARHSREHGDPSRRSWGHGRRLGGDNRRPCELAGDDGPGIDLTRLGEGTRGKAGFHLRATGPMDALTGGARPR